MFTVATSLTRLAAGPRNLFITSQGTMTDAQKLQRVNEVLETFYEEGSWRGVHTTLALTSSSGIITLPAAYLRLDKRIRITTEGHCGCYLDVVSQVRAYQEAGPGKSFCNAAIDLGDNASGVRRYQLTDDADQYAAVDALAYEGLARKRFNWITDTSTVVVPDSYPALELGIRAKHATDEQANELAKDLWAQAFAKLDAGLGEYEQGNQWGPMPIDPACATHICNIV